MSKFKNKKNLIAELEDMVIVLLKIVSFYQDAFKKQKYTIESLTTRVDESLRTISKLNFELGVASKKTKSPERDIEKEMDDFDKSLKNNPYRNKKVNRWPNIYKSSCKVPNCTCKW